MIIPPYILHTHSKRYYLNRWIECLQDYWKPNIYQITETFGPREEIQHDQLKYKISIRLLSMIRSIEYLLTY